MYVDYDVNDPKITTEVILLNTLGATSGAMWQKNRLPVDCKKFNQPKSYLVRNNTTTYTDYLLYDPVNVYVGTINSGDTNALGKIWVSYEIELMIPDATYSLPIRSANWFYSAVTQNGNESWNTPNFNTSSAVSYYAGNLVFEQLANGWYIPEAFTGYLTMYYFSAGLDTSRPILLSVDGGGTQESINAFLDDTTLGTDTEIKTWKITVPPTGANIIWGGPIISSNTNTVNMYMIWASANPRWFNSVDPNVVPTLMSSLKEIQNPKDKSSLIQKHYKTLGFTTTPPKEKKKKIKKIIEEDSE
jgi:hypothetical protein